jgi:hypothetical protein
MKRVLSECEAHDGMYYEGSVDIDSIWSHVMNDINRGEIRLRQGQVAEGSQDQEQGIRCARTG